MPHLTSPKVSLQLRHHQLPSEKAPPLVLEIVSYGPRSAHESRALRHQDLKIALKRIARATVWSHALHRHSLMAAAPGRTSYSIAAKTGYVR